MMKRHLYLVLGLASILLFWAWGFYYLQNGGALSPFLIKLLGQEGAELFAQKPWPNYFLPQAELTGSYTTTSLILFFWLERALGGTANTHVLVHSLEILSAAWIVHSFWRSRLATLMAALCVALSTHNYHMFQVTGSTALPLISMYCLWTLYFHWRVVTSKSYLWLLPFALSMIVFSLSYEGWIDYVGWFLVASPFLLYYFHKYGEREKFRHLFVSGVCVGVLTVGYLLVKTTMGYGQHAGTESDVIFNYKAFAPIFETLLGNLIKNVFLTLTNFLPSFIGNSQTLQHYGEKWVIDQQQGYHAEFSHLAYMDTLFYWRYFAGAAFAFFCYFFVRLGMRLARTRDDRGLTIFVLTSIVLLSGTTHALVKFRPFNSLPFIGYHVWFGVLGITGLLAYSHVAIDRTRWKKWRKNSLHALLFALVIFAYFERPYFLAQSVKQFKMGKYPLPFENLKALLVREPSP